MKKGIFVKIRKVEINDAEFTLALRLDPKISQFIFKTPPDLEKQKEWIKNQQKKTDDHYFLIEDLNDKKLGTIAIYDVEKNCAELGRWLSRGNSLQNIDSIILTYDFAFEQLKLEYIDSFTNKNNKNVVNFHKTFGADFIEEIAEFQYKNFPDRIIKNRVEKNKYYDTLRPKQIELLQKFL